MKTLIFFLLTCMCTLHANNTFYHANESFQNQQYEYTVSLLEADTHHSFAKFINLGYAYLQLNDEHKAWLNFERAKQVQPYAKKVKDAFDHLQNGHNKWQFISITNTWWFYQCIGAIALLSAVVFSIFTVVSIRKKIIYKKSIIISGMALSALLLYAISAKNMKNYGITMQNDIPVHISPSNKSTEIVKLTQPQAVIIEKYHGNYVYVDMPMLKLSGWIEKKYISSITF